ncbi:MAG: hypothetical protein JW786_07210 [Desulfobacterales bacterium]|nr:hypothetical protein [Desulfobacterales bacterium]
MATVLIEKMEFPVISQQNSEVKVKPLFYYSNIPTHTTGPHPAALFWLVKTAFDAASPHTMTDPIYPVADG